MSNPVSTDIHDEIAVLTIANAPVNALGAAVRKGIVDALDALETQPQIKAVILTGSGKFFSAGADITEFGKPRVSPHLRDVILRLENYHLPTLAAINGAALGGGLELALGCRYRTCHVKAKLGLPEVNLGLIPGAGGTQRLPRLIGTQNAAEIICYGKPLRPQQAMTLSLVDAVFDENFIQQSAEYFQGHLKHITAGTQTLRLSLADTTFKNEPELETWLPQFKQLLIKKSKGQLSPLKALEAVSDANDFPLRVGLDVEAKIFAECMESDQRAGLIHAFFAERKVTKLPQYDNVAPLTVEKIGILGAGTMGIGISLAFAAKGYAVCLYDISEDALSGAKTRIEATLDGNVKKSRMSADQRDAALANLSYHTSLTELKNVDLVIEAVVERMDVKKAVFKELDTLLKPSAILASNTSYLDINEIGSVTSRADKIIGMHFFSPANIMKLLEVIKTDHASDETIATALAVAKTVGKIPVIAGMCDGFIGNRIFKAYRKQAEHLVEDGALPQDVDRVLTEFGFAMGPFAVSDLAGLDIGWHTRRREDATRPKEERYTDLPDRLYDLGRLGQKSGSGWYTYETGGRTPIVDPAVEAMILAACEEKGITRRKISDEEIRERILFTMINTGADILHENIAARALDIDTVYLHGYGFPRHQGGPMFYADKIGTRHILDRINSFATTDPVTWKPSPLLETLAQTNAKFHDIKTQKT